MTKLAIEGGEPIRKKPFPTWPAWDENEIKNLTGVIRSGKWGCLQGKQVKEFEERFAKYHEAKYGICVNSGTTALRLALLAAGIGRGDEVVVPAYTFIASATAIIEAGAVPIFGDIDPETYNLNPEEIEKRLTPHTRAVMVVHFAGRAAPMTRIREICQKHDLKIVEDAAQAWGSEWQGQKVGALGDAGAFSFQSSKNITSGEGGIILTNDEEIAKFARSFSNCGRLEGGVWYEHYYLGGNVRMTEFQGAVLLAQLARYENMKRHREENAAYLDGSLSQIPGILPVKRTQDITSHAYHLYIFRYQQEHFSNQPKEWFIQALKAEGIPVSPGYSIPLYKQPVLQNRAFGPRGKSVDIGVDYARVHLPETERACSHEAVWLGQSVLLGTREDMTDIVKAIEKIQVNASRK